MKYELMVEWLRNSLTNVEVMSSITNPEQFFFSLCVGRTVDELSISAPPTPYYHFYARVSCPLCVGRTVDELSISAPPTPYYYFYARVSCRVCIVPKCAKAMEYLSSWA